MYQLICFDLDDTLWPCLPTIQYAEKTIYDWLIEHKPQITNRYTIEQLREKRKRLLEAQPSLINDLSEARRVHLRQLAEEFNDSADWVETAFDVFYQARQNVTLFDDVIPVLSSLKKNYTLVALTNGNAHISKTGLSDYFDFQVSAADVEAAKPHPAMFIRAIQKVGVTPAQTLHVGDHPVHDIRGGRNAGIDVAWVNRYGQVWDTNDDSREAASSEKEPELQFRDLYQLNDWLAS